jgi:hypothetical protein
MMIILVLGIISNNTAIKYLPPIQPEIIKSLFDRPPCFSFNQCVEDEDEFVTNACGLYGSRGLSIVDRLADEGFWPIANHCRLLLDYQHVRGSLGFACPLHRRIGRRGSLVVDDRRRQANDRCCSKGEKDRA